MYNDLTLVLGRLEKLTTMIVYANDFDTINRKNRNQNGLRIYSKVFHLLSFQKIILPISFVQRSISQMVLRFIEMPWRIGFWKNSDKGVFLSSL